MEKCWSIWLADTYCCMSPWMVVWFKELEWMEICLFIIWQIKLYTLSLWKVDMKSWNNKEISGGWVASLIQFLQEKLLRNYGNCHVSYTTSRVVMGCLRETWGILAQVLVLGGWPPSGSAARLRRHKKGIVEQEVQICVFRLLQSARSLISRPGSSNSSPSTPELWSC